MHGERGQQAVSKRPPVQPQDELLSSAGCPHPRPTESPPLPFTARTAGPSRSCSRSLCATCCSACACARHVSRAAPGKQGCPQLEGFLFAHDGSKSKFSVQKNATFQKEVSLGPRPCTEHTKMTPQRQIFVSSKTARFPRGNASCTFTAFANKFSALLEKS